MLYSAHVTLEEILYLTIFFENQCNPQFGPIFIFAQIKLSSSGNTAMFISYMCYIYVQYVWKDWKKTN